MIYQPFLDLRHLFENIIQIEQFSVNIILWFDRYLAIYMIWVVLIILRFISFRKVVWVYHVFSNLFC